MSLFRQRLQGLETVNCRVLDFQVVVLEFNLNSYDLHYQSEIIVRYRRPNAKDIFKVNHVKQTSRNQSIKSKNGELY